MGPSPLRRVLQLVLIATLIAQAGWLAWALVAPLPKPPAPTTAAGRADLSILSRFDPFARAGAPEGPGPAGQGSSGYALFGVRADGRGGGSAILSGPDGVQGSFAVGEEVAPGVVLKAVQPDHVVLTAGASRLRVAFATPAAGAAPIPAAQTLSAPEAAASAAPGEVEGAALLREAGLSRRMVDGRENGFTVTPRGGGEALRRAGLRPGDVILAVNGENLTTENVSEIQRLLALSPVVELRVERDGRPQTLSFRTRP